MPPADDGAETDGKAERAASAGSADGDAEPRSDADARDGAGTTNDAKRAGESAKAGEGGGTGEDERSSDSAVNAGDPPPESDREAQGQANTEAGRSADDTAMAAMSTVTVLVGDIKGGVNQIGTQGRAAPRAIVGAMLVEVDLLADETVVYVSDATEQLIDLLVAQHLVVVVGPANTGKHFAALHALGQVHPGATESRTAYEFAPTASLVEICEAIGKRRRYLADITRSMAPQETAREVGHKLAKIAQDLRASDSYMVLSLEAGQHRVGRYPHTLPWTTPDPSTLFEHLCRSHPRLDALAGEDLSWLVDRLSAEPRMSPELVSRVVAMLASGCTADEVQDLVTTGPDKAADAEVLAWLDRDPPEEEVRYAIVVGLLGGLDEVTLERSYADLRQRSETAPDRKVTQDRHLRLELPFLERTADSAWFSPTHGVDVRSRAYRRALLDGLWQRYGPTLWDVVDAWVHDLPRRLTFDMIEWLGRGLSCMAGSAYGWVWDRLDRWWGGTIIERHAAVRTVAHMSTDARIALTVLNDSLRSRHTTTERAWTTDLILGGPLGAAFPGIAVPALWAAVLTGPHHGTAGLGLWNLLAGDDQTEERSALILDYIRGDIFALPVAERSSHLCAALHVLGARFGTDENAAAAGLQLADQPRPRRLFVRLLAAAMVDRRNGGAAQKAAFHVVTALVRQSRVEDRRRDVIALVEEAAGQLDARHADIALQHCRETVQRVLRDQPHDLADDVLRRAFARRTSTASLTRPQETPHARTAR